MSALLEPLSLKKLCLHTITTKPWNLEQAIGAYSKAGIGGVSVWRDAAQKHSEGFAHARKMIQDSGLELVSYVRGGFFAGASRKERQDAIEENRRVIEEAAELGAPLIVLVCGAVPGQELSVSRAQIREGLEAVLPDAEACGIKLGIEPLHPMYADSRSAVNTMKQANDLAESIGDPHLGVTVDVFHLWWDDALEAEILRCGRSGKLFSYHICDWKNQPKDMLNDRGLMGEGCIPLKQIRSWVEAAGFTGFHEVEIFSDDYWAMDQSEFLEKIKQHYLQYA